MWNRSMPVLSRFIDLSPVVTKFFVPASLARDITSTLKNKNWACLCIKKSIPRQPIRYDSIYQYCNDISIFSIYRSITSSSSQSSDCWWLSTSERALFKPKNQNDCLRPCPYLHDRGQQLTIVLQSVKIREQIDLRSKTRQLPHLVFGGGGAISTLVSISNTPALAVAKENYRVINILSIRQS